MAAMMWQQSPAVPLAGLKLRLLARHSVSRTHLNL